MWALAAQQLHSSAAGSSLIASSSNRQWLPASCRIVLLQDQGTTCATCVGFAATAAMEAAINV
jgi:hypothetical protein